MRMSKQLGSWNGKFLMLAVSSAIVLSGVVSVLGVNTKPAYAAECRSYLYGYGGNGNCVKQIQYLLRGWSYHASQGYYTRHLTPDGDFGPNTLKAVKKFQGAFGLKQDGIVGPKTWSKLCNPGFGGGSEDSWSRNWSAAQEKAC